MAVMAAAMASGWLSFSSKAKRGKARSKPSSGAKLSMTRRRPQDRQDRDVLVDTSEERAHGLRLPAEINDQNIGLMAVKVALQVRAIDLPQHDAAALLQHGGQASAAQEAGGDDEQLGLAG